MVKCKEIFKGGYGPFQIINHLISTLEREDANVILLMDLFTSAPPFDVFVCKGPDRRTPKGCKSKGQRF